MPSWRDHIKIHPACELFPEMSEPELKELGNDIKKNGLKNPIVFWSPGDRHAENPDVFLLDGRSRLDAMELVGVNPWKFLNCSPLVDNRISFSKKWLLDGREAVVRLSEFRDDSADTDPIAYVVSANLHRRHLTAEQKHDLITNVLKAQPGSSDRAIAKITKVSDKTVGTVRRELEGRAEIPHVKTRTDSKGRQQPVHKPKAISVKPPPPPTLAQRVEDKIRQAAIADKKKHGDLSPARIMDEVVAGADPEELVALANHSASERHVPARQWCESHGIDWKPVSEKPSLAADSPDAAAEERKAFYAQQDDALEADDDGLPALPKSNVGEKQKREHVIPSPDQILSNVLFIIRTNIETALSQIGPASEVFGRVRNLIDKMEAEAKAKTKAKAQVEESL